MTCSNPHCQSARRDHLVLFSGGLCKECHSSGIAVLFQAIPEPPKQKKKMGKPVGAVPFDKTAYDKTFGKERRMHVPRQVKRWVIEHKDCYRQWNNHPTGWGELNTAKLYASERMANMAQAKTGFGTVVLL